MSYQPAYWSLLRHSVTAISLSHEPAQISICRYAMENRSEASHHTSNVCSKHPFSGKQRHLSVIGNRAQFAVGSRHILDAFRPELFTNGIEMHEFNRCAQRISHGATE